MKRSIMYHSNISHIKKHEHFNNLLIKYLYTLKFKIIYYMKIYSKYFQIISVKILLFLFNISNEYHYNIS